MTVWRRLLTALVCFFAVRTAFPGDLLYVSNLGSDVNTGGREDPLYGLQTSLSSVSDGGTIRILDSSANSPGVLVGKTVTIEGAGGMALIRSYTASSYAIACMFAAQSDTFRDLNIQGSRSGDARGIYFLGNSLTLENVTFRNCSIGLDLSSANNGNVTLRNCAFENCSTAIKSIASSTAITITLDNVRISDCGTGIDAQNGTRLVVRGSNISHCTTGLAISRGTTLSKAEFDNTNISFNTTGIKAGSGASTVRLGNCLISNNTTALQAAGGTFYSFGTNRVAGNGSDGAAMQSIALK